MSNLFTLVDSEKSLSFRRSKWQRYGEQVEEGLRQTPSLQSASVFNVMRHDLDKDTQDMDDAIASLKATIERLERAKLRVQQIQGRLSAVFAPVRRLPDEILRMIFWLIADDTPLNVESFYDAYLCFSLVHPTWARVCHGLSWAPSLEIHDVQEKAAISFAMERCGRPLLHVDYDGNIASWEHLLSFSERLSGLQIAVTRQQWDVLLPVAPRLHHIHSIILDAMDDDSDEPWSDVLSHIPNLTSVSFVGSNEQGVLTSVPWSRLTHLSDTRSGAVVAPDLYLDILQHTPSLISVDLRYAIPTKITGANLAPRNLVMPNLRRLTVGDSRLLQSFSSLPILEHLELALRWSGSLNEDCVALPFQLVHRLVQDWGAAATLTSLSFGGTDIETAAEGFSEDFVFLEQLLSTICRRLLQLKVAFETPNIPHIDRWLCRLNATISNWCVSGERKSVALQISDSGRDIYPRPFSFISKGLLPLMLSGRLRLEIVVSRWVRYGEAGVVLSSADLEELKKQKSLGKIDFLLQYHNTFTGETIDWCNPPPPPSQASRLDYAAAARTYSSCSFQSASQGSDVHETLRRSDSASTLQSNDSFVWS